MPSNVRSAVRGEVWRVRESSEARKRQKRIKQLKRDLHSLMTQLDARSTGLTKIESYAILSGIDAHITLLKLVYNDNCVDIALRLD